MTDFNTKEKLILNHMVGLSREYRFGESRHEIIKAASLPQQYATFSIPELRKIIDTRIKNQVTPPIVSEMLRIESTFRHIRDIENFNPNQAEKKKKNLDETIPYLNNKNLWFILHKMNQIYHFSGEKHFRYKLNETPKNIDKVRLLNRMLKDKKKQALTPNYINEFKKQISINGINEINQLLEKTQNPHEKIRLNEEKIYLIDNSSWSRSQRFLNKSSTYGELNKLYEQINNSAKAKDMVEKQNLFRKAYQKAQKFHPDYRNKQAQEDWDYR